MKKTIELNNLGMELCRIGIANVLDSLINYLSKLDSQEEYIKELIGNLSKTIKDYESRYES